MTESLPPGIGRTKEFATLYPLAGTGTDSEGWELFADADGALVRDPLAHDLSMTWDIWIPLVLAMAAPHCAHVPTVPGQNFFRTLDPDGVPIDAYVVMDALFVHERQGWVERTSTFHLPPLLRIALCYEAEHLGYRLPAAPRVDILR